MKITLRHIALLVMLAACLGSCDHDTTQEGGEAMPVPETYTPIAFTAQQGEESTVTRAAATDAAATRPYTRADKGLEEVLPAGDKVFKVWAYKNTAAEGDSYTSYQTVMEGYTVRWAANSSATTTTNTHDWEYVNQQSSGQEEQTIKYWDWNAKAYRFFGYAGSDVTVTPVPDATPTSYTLSFTADATSTYTIDATPYYSHLWLSTPADGTFGKAVALEFLKPYTRVRFMFVSDDPTNMPIEDIDIANPSFKPTDNGVIEQRGTATVTYPLTGTGTKETVAFSGTTGLAAFERHYYEVSPDENDQAMIAGQKYFYTVLPATGQGNYTLTVDINGEKQTCVVPEAFMDWLPSYQYTYIFKIHADGGVTIGGVQSAFTQWDTINTNERTVFNW